MVEGSSSCGMPGFIEVIRRGVLQRVFEDFRLTKETKLIDEVLRRISKGEAVAYGFDEVKKAVEYGAVETLLVVDEILREERDKGTDIDSLLTDVERSGGEVVILSSEFEAGKRLLHIGGVAALLRFSI
jgi:protein pelota